MKKKLVTCKVCSVQFERFVHQQEGPLGWRCSAACREIDRLQKTAKPCLECGATLQNTTRQICEGCTQSKRMTECLWCQRPCQKKKGTKKQFCGEECKKKHARKNAKTWAECGWCGKDFKRWLYATGDRNGGRFCSLHCRHSSVRLRNYVKARLRKSRATISLQQQKQDHGIDEEWLACRVSRLETAETGKTDEQLWEEKIKSLCNVNRHRETMAVLQHRADWGTHKRNQQNDWKHGGAWDRIVFFELKRLRKRANNCQDYLWYMWLVSICSNQRKRMKRKQAAGCRHGE